VGPQWLPEGAVPAECHPQDAPEEEILEHFRKVGIIKEDLNGARAIFALLCAAKL
jgi:hypothetical protein